MLTEIPEKDATGEIAAIFAEVRRLWGVPYVSAIQRHLATRPGVLEWAWEAVGPAFHSGEAQAAGAAAARDVAMPPLDPVPRAALAAWSIDDDALAAIKAVCEGFVRVAPVNMVFAGLIKALLLGGAGRRSPDRRIPLYVPPAALPAPPAMIAPETLPEDRRGILLAFATDSGGKPFIPGLYRMLAHWPGLLAHLATVLTPRLSRPEMHSACDAVRERIDAALPALLAGLPSTPTVRPMPSPAERTHFLTVGETYRKTSPELVVLGRLIKEALP